MRLWTPDMAYPFFWFDADNSAANSTTSCRNLAPHFPYTTSSVNIISFDSRAIRGAGGTPYNNKMVWNLSNAADGTGSANTLFTTKAYRGNSQFSFFVVGDVHRTGLSAIPIFLTIYSATKPYMDLRLRATDATTTEFTVGGIRETANSYQSVAATRSGVAMATPSIYAGLFDYENAQLYVGIDGVYTARGGGFQTAGSIDAADMTFRVGNYTENNPAPDAVAEWIGFYGILSVERRQALEGYLAHKYGLTAQLQASHPYKLFPPVVFDDNTPMGTLVNVTGNATVLDNGAASRVLAYKASTLQQVGEATPDAQGDWSMVVPVGDCYFTYFSSECQPITHGPYTVSA